MSSDSELKGSDAFERAVSLAENNQASLTVVDVAERVTAGIGMPEGGPISADLQAAMVNAHAQGLEALVEPYRSRIEIQTKVLIGTPFLEIIREVLRNGHDLVIKMPRTPGIGWTDYSAVTICICCASAPARFGSSSRKRRNPTGASWRRSMWTMSIRRRS